MTDQDPATGSSLRDALQVPRRRLGIILLCAVLAPAAALVVSLLQEKQYAASASLLFRNPELDQKLFGSTGLQTSTDPTREGQTNVTLVSLDVVADRSARRLGGIRADAVADKIEVAPEGQSDVVSITATDPNPELAAKLANTFARQYIAFRREADRSKVSEAGSLVKRQLDALPTSERAGRRGASLRNQSEQLDLLSALQTGNAELVQPAEVPSSPSSPKTARNTLLGALLGLLLGFALAVLLERLDRRVRDPHEVEEIFGRPILGGVPESRALSRSTDDPTRLPAMEAEAFRLLRASLRYFNLSQEIRSLVITSAAPGDGKSTVAWNLAAAAAAAGDRVLLIEADLRHPTLAARYDLPAQMGLSQALATSNGSDGAAPARVAVAAHGASNSASNTTMDVLPAGPLPPNPSDLVESERMRSLITQAERGYDLVVIDTPPTSIVSDAIPLVRQVSGVLVVTRLGRTTRDAAAHLNRQLRNLDAPTLGVVVNGVGKQSSYYGGYAYGLGQSEDYGERVEGVDLAPTGVVETPVASVAQESSGERNPRAGSNQKPISSSEDPAVPLEASESSPRSSQRGRLRKRS